MALLPKTDVVFVGFGMVGGIIANELGKRTSLEHGRTGARAVPHHQSRFPDGPLRRVALRRAGPAVQDLARETWTFRNDSGRAPCPSANTAPGCQATASAAPWSTGTVSSGASSITSSTTAPTWSSATARTSSRRTRPSRTGASPTTELEPYYDQFDKTFGTRARRATSTARSSRAATRSRVRAPSEYPQPPNQMAYGPALFKAAAEELGYQGVSAAHVQQPGHLPQSRRPGAGAVQLLRLLRALRLPRRREGQPDHHRHPERPEERPSRDSRVLATCFASTPAAARRHERVVLRRRPARSRSSRRT